MGLLGSHKTAPCFQATVARKHTIICRKGGWGGVLMEHVLRVLGECGVKEEEKGKHTKLSLKIMCQWVESSHLAPPHILPVAGIIPCAWQLENGPETETCPVCHTAIPSLQTLGVRLVPTDILGRGAVSHCYWQLAPSVAVAVAVEPFPTIHFPSPPPQMDHGSVTFFQREDALFVAAFLI
ncbi:hypothetical protein GBAR_LOCUS20204 [Geodia barretti]|uniref:Uncharacterized protein n=1 Tax=Geodia barretti TaxID=519541 RepID=A0AA35X2V3_GEOBA|nr:hypothetical protein GBAR_LOCUS20204 [Geodia barretti]